MQKIHDYLTKQIYVDNNIVTFRSLSRQFGLHVNAAKNHLATFHANSVGPETRSFATYIISGEPYPQASAKGASQATQESMDVDMESADTLGEGEGEEEVPITTLTLVGEHELEGAKSTYARIFSIHVYCLSPSRLTDAGLICEPSAAVYKADELDPTASMAIGRVVGPDVRMGKTPPVASSSKVPQPVSRKPTLKVKNEDTKPSWSDKDKDNMIKPKASGKLDWSKAKKSSEGVKKEIEEPPVRPKEKSPADFESPQDGTKRGVKRKVAPLPATDTEAKQKTKEKSPEVTSPHNVKLRKNCLVSDDEDDDHVPAPLAKPKPNRRMSNRLLSEDEDEAPAPQPKSISKSKYKAAISAFESNAERSLRAMMEMDDSDVELASKGRAKSWNAITSDEDVDMAASDPDPVPPSEQEREDEDIDMDMDVPKPKPRKKAAKKTWPIGSNGLKKKRIVKSRVTTDAKGYMVTENYSEYESVDEEEAEAKKPPKGKKASAAKPRKSEADEKASPKLKPAVRSNSSKKSAGPRASAQGNLKDFFGKPKK